MSQSLARSSAFSSGYKFQARDEGVLVSKHRGIKISRVNVRSAQTHRLCHGTQIHSRQHAFRHEFSCQKQNHSKLFSSATVEKIQSAKQIYCSLSPFSGEIDSREINDLTQERVGVLLLNLGGPETLQDVQPFLYNLFADPDIIRLPRLFRFLQQPLAKFISVIRAPKAKEGYAAIGGGSPLRRITDEQAEALKTALEAKGVPARVYVAMRYWHPFTEAALEQIKRDRITQLVVLPLYPHFSISTTGSSLTVLQSIFKQDEYFRKLPYFIIKSWYQREGYIRAMARLIEKELQGFQSPNEVMIFFSAHGVPCSYVEKYADPYKSQMEECVSLVMKELKASGIYNEHILAYQSRVGPVEWLKPYTDETIVQLGQKGVKNLLVVPVSFVSEHIETLEEIDKEYKHLAFNSGIEHWGRVPALGCEPSFISDLADAVTEALPSVGAMESPDFLSGQVDHMICT
eukprot:TRINITY_DN493_c1_g1_i1.p1 TRINITY_DN493_c1_g1~~TRINITY_DN493_c1_g1_i1.p1  ORF type:complete len:459 (-),score=84.21 TRINITY_DN493_c1_g1_i1:480-1856(-)